MMRTRRSHQRRIIRRAGLVDAQSGSWRGTVGQLQEFVARQDHRLGQPANAFAFLKPVFTSFRLLNAGLDAANLRPEVSLFQVSLEIGQWSCTESFDGVVEQGENRLATFDVIFLRNLGEIGQKLLQMHLDGRCQLIPSVQREEFGEDAGILAKSFGQIDGLFEHLGRFEGDDRRVRVVADAGLGGGRVAAVVALGRLGTVRIGHDVEHIHFELSVQGTSDLVYRVSDC